MSLNKKNKKKWKVRKDMTKKKNLNRKKKNKHTPQKITRKLWLNRESKKDKWNMSLNSNPNQIHKISSQMKTSRLSMNYQKLIKRPKSKRLKIKISLTEFRNQNQQKLRRFQKKMCKMSRTKKKKLKRKKMLRFNKRRWSQRLEW